jgi:hypothetical protein
MRSALTLRIFSYVCKALGMSEVDVARDRHSARTPPSSTALAAPWLEVKIYSKQDISGETK